MIKYLQTNHISFSCILHVVLFRKMLPTGGWMRNTNTVIMLVSQYIILNSRPRFTLFTFQFIIHLKQVIRY